MDNKIREEILKLDNYKCRFYGCGKTTNLEIHHLIPRSFVQDINYNIDDPSNLITLCSYHHKLITEKRISNLLMLKKIIYKDDFRWNYPYEYYVLKEKITKIKRNRLNVK